MDGNGVGGSRRRGSEPGNGRVRGGKEPGNPPNQDRSEAECVTLSLATSRYSREI